MATERVILTGQQLIEAAAVPRECVDLKGIGSVYVRGMTAGEAGKIGQLHNRGHGERLAASMACWCVVDEDGRRLFADDQLQTLMDLRADTLQTIAEVVLRLSGLEGGADVALADAQGK